jgi:hypothetical protein
MPKMCLSLSKIGDWKQTITLSNGDVVLDMNGEWDYNFEPYGKWDMLPKMTNVLEIKMEGNSFVGIRKNLESLHSPGSEAIRGELDKTGIKKIQYITQHQKDPIDAKGEIHDNGNKITIEASQRCKITLTRR